MLFIIAALYFLRIQSVASNRASNHCPRLRCVSKRSYSQWTLRCHLSRSEEVQAALRLQSTHGSAPRWRELGPRREDGLCISEYVLDHVRSNNNVSTSTIAQWGSLYAGQPSDRVTLPQRERRDLVCDTVDEKNRPTRTGSKVWNQCTGRVPRVEIEEQLPEARKAVCVVCPLPPSPGDRAPEREFHYYSIAPTLLLRVVFAVSTTPTAPISVRLDFPLVPSSVAKLLPRRPSSSQPRPDSARSPADRSEADADKDAVISKTSRLCRWKCAYLEFCLTSTALVCDGISHCPLNLDELWCPLPAVTKTPTGSYRARNLSMALVYSLIGLGCVLSVLFLVWCIAWIFLGRNGAPSALPSVPSRSRRRRTRSTHSSHNDADFCSRSLLDCPCSSCCAMGVGRLCSASSGGSTFTRRPGLLVDQPSTGCSSSGVFEESGGGSCIQCVGPPKTTPVSDSSSAISGCGAGDVDSATMETMVCKGCCGPRSAPPTTGAHRQLTTHNPLRKSRGSSESIGYQQSQARQHHHHHHHHHHRSRPRRHLQFQESSTSHHSQPSHQLDWQYGLPASVRRSNDDSEPRLLTSPSVQTNTSVESGRLLPPPNLNPFLDEPQFRRQVSAPTGDTGESSAT